jgi:hypothetical protein
MIEKTKQTKKQIARWLKRKRQNKYNYYQKIDKKIPSDIPIFYYMGV